MGQRGQRRNAAVKDVLIMLGKEECALGMVQRRNDINALLINAQIVLKEVEFA